MSHANTCNCCQGLAAQTPVLVANRPGLGALAYRVGTHAQFKQSLLARLAAAGPALAAFTARQDDDFTVGLLDAWATVADVLTFYQERIANESYLRTATERFSVRELARLIGYELRPGAAASTCLAFTLDEPAAGAPGGQAGPASLTIAPETKVQSVPGPGEQAQTFETVEAVEARAEWNAIRPRSTQPQAVRADMPVLVLQGTAYALKVGDVLLINKAKLRKVLKVSIDDAVQTTRVDFVAAANFPPYVAPVPPRGQVQAFLSAPGLSGRTVGSLRQASWREGDLAALALVNRWSARDLASSFAAPAPPRAAAGEGVQVFRKRAFFFGYNAPLKVVYSGNVPTFQEWPADEGPTNIFLDAAYDELLPGGVVAIQGPSEALEAVKNIIDVQQVDVRSRSAYGLSTKTTALTVAGDWRQLVSSNLTDLGPLRVRTVYAQSEPLAVADVPIDDPVAGDVVALDRYYSGLRPGQKMVLSGDRSDLPGVAASEVLTLKDVTVVEGRTVLGLVQALAHAYGRPSVVLNGNVAFATHGETVRETLGSGDASRAFQRFVLRQSPLTYVGDAGAAGVASTLEIRVNDVRWHEVPALLGHGPQETIYTTQADDEANTTVLFGDGVTGARLPTGPENVRARYRKGLGLGGLVRAGQLAQLLSRPLGVKGVNNPLPAAGAADREALANARQNAPLQVLTLGRIVSLPDYADFARAFAGVGKALATWTWAAQRRRVFVTVAGADGGPIARGSALYQNLLQAMRQAGDPNVAVAIATYEPAFFRLVARVKVAPDYLPAQVLPAVEAALRRTFSFAARDFGQLVAPSAVIAAIQQVPGVEATELDALFRTEDETTGPPPGPAGALDAQMPRSGGDAVFAAELLLLDPRPVDLRLLP